MSKKRLWNKNSLLLAVLTASAMLTGCGEGSDSGFVAPVKPGTEQTQYYAQDVVRQNSSAGTFYVDLSTNIGSSDGTETALNQVTALNSDADCRVVSQNNNGFTLKASGAQVCDYRYRVGSVFSMVSTEISGSGYAEATVRAVMGNSSDLLMPISAVTSTGNAVSINIRDELGKLGYELDESFVLSDTVTLPLASTTHSAAIANPDEHRIEYIPGAGIPSGVERVLYSYTNTEGNVLAGTIDVAVSSESNNPPAAKSAKVTEIVDPDTGEIRATVPWNKTIELDVASLISDPDGDELQLIDVFAYGATVTILQDANGDGNPFNDTVFQLHTTESGTKDISYTVSDLKGGYATGVIEVDVDGPYADIGDFSAPHTAQQAAGFGAQFEPYGPGDGVTALNSVINASYDFERAEALCATQGKYLPYESKLKNLYKEYSNQSIFNQKNWPINLPYWMKDGATFDLGAGTTASANNTEYRYVTCISNGKVEIISVEVDEKSELEVATLRGLKQEPKLKVTYETGETKIADAQLISVQDPSVAEVTEDNGVVGINAGMTKIYMELDGHVVDYTLNVVDVDMFISGAALMSVGDKRALNVSYKNPVSGEIYDIDDSYILKFTSDAPEIANLEQVGDGSYYITGVAQGKTRISADVDLYNYIYHVEADVTVINDDWCWKDGVSDTTGYRVCIGYDEAVTTSPGIKEFVTTWGEGSRNPYVKSKNLYDFCKAFNLEPFELTDISEKIIVESGTIEEIYYVARWLTIWVTEPKIFKHKTTLSTTNAIRFSDYSDSSDEAVPICLLPNSKQNNIQARMLSD
ncbi:Ig-like domain-containing protein [Vibrio furnissii]|uniref:Ig-like domain-containing protein n=1 Tax=Vibrio furnissii TaxID=29494 RepID=UPI0023DCC243|nr:hypothetical protein [Vibrio furnissii]